MSVVECGGLSAAEYTLGVGHSAISKHLSDLEARLMVLLCERGRSGFSITPMASAGGWPATHCRIGR
ncbi:LysR family transcriptional regulator [Rhizobium sp. BR 362]